MPPLMRLILVRPRPSKNNNPLLIGMSHFLEAVMRVTQGAFSFLADLTDEQIKAQVQYCLNNGWAPALEYTRDPHPRNTYWEMHGLPMFDCARADEVMQALQDCRRAQPDAYIRLSAFDNSFGVESVVLSFIVQRPEVEPTFRLIRSEDLGRVRYRIAIKNHYGGGNDTSFDF